MKRFISSKRVTIVIVMSVSVLMIGSSGCSQPVVVSSSGEKTSIESSLVGDSGIIASSAESITDVSDHINQEYLNTLTETYVRPLMPSGTILLSSWKVAEEIKADDLICFCAYNNLLNLPVTPSGRTIGQGAEYIDHTGAAEKVETAVQCYFDVSAEYLRTSKLYNYYDEDFDIHYTEAYLLPDGFGGGGSAKALSAREDGDKLILTVGIFGPDNSKEPAVTGKLIISVQDSEFRYLSYEVVDSQ